MTGAPAGNPAGRILAFNGGLLVDRRLRRMLAAAGIRPRPGWPRAGDAVAVWGQSPYARRGERLAARTGVPLWRIEDAFLRSVLPGRARGGGGPLGLLVDRAGGVHFDPRAPSDLETLLATHPLDDPALLTRARDGIAFLRRHHLSKYCAFDPAAPAPAPGYVLVVDQTAGDASVTASGAGPATFRAMLAAARAEHPGARIVIRRHPETTLGLRAGHFTAADLEGAEVSDGAVSPWHLLAGARAVYAVSSQLAFEAMLAGHHPVLFGQPFCAGWGLSDDRAGAPARRGRSLTVAQLFAGAMLLAPLWFDPCRGRVCSFEDAARQLGAEARAWRDDHRGWVATGMRLWKRAPLQRMFGRQRPVAFVADPDTAIARAAREGRRLMVWAGHATQALDAAGAVRVEDGLLRSRGLGAALVPPLSLVLDDRGIYYDPSRESRLEALIARACTLDDGARARAGALVARILAGGVTKYNQGGAGLPDGLPAGRRILVPGQVEDDASIRLGAGDIRTNRALLLAARAVNPRAVILYKPHPDTEAGLRPGALPDAAELADAVLPGTDPALLLAGVDAVWTMTSGLGFEALLRGLPVTCTGAPFYAGWGLTQDRGPVPARRQARPDLLALAHAVLVDYPRYTDPVSGLPCPPEVALARLESGVPLRRGAANRALAKAQGWLAGVAWVWR
ncbi:MAG: capsular polysaccharide biosynthesis protein [Rubellimicrobium sp.]|nr:capsular polysaccharide biosynthesis protein [Rubellimicrobium sp.]